MGSWGAAASLGGRLGQTSREVGGAAHLHFRPYPLVNFFFFFFGKNEQADSTFFSVETDVASTGSPLSPLQAQCSTPSARRW